VAWNTGHHRRRSLAYTAIAMLTAMLLGMAVLRVGVAAVVLPVAAAALAAIIWRPQVGLYALVAFNLIFEMNSPDPLMLPGRYLHYGLQSSLGISGFIASPLELLLVLMAAVWFIKGLVSRTLRFRGGDLGWSAALFFMALVAGVVRGAAGGGDMYIAFWEVRSLLYLGIAYILAANLIRTRRDVATLVAVFLVANGVYALEGALRYVLWIRPDTLGVAAEFNYGHEVVIFLAVLVLQAVVQVVVGGPLWRRVFGLLLLPLGVFTLLATERRAGYIALAIAFLMMTIHWLVRHRKAVMLILVPAVVGASIYLPIFWNNTGILGQPARAVRSLTAPDARDASSNEYRDLELVNVLQTIRADPLLGVGFGRPFTFYVPLPDLSWWPFWHFQPHHKILWMWLKVGAPGFAVFLLLMMGALALASSRALTLSDPTLTTFAYIALVSIVTTMVFCYVDLGLTNGRVTSFLGVVLGVLAVLRQIDREPVAQAVGPGRAYQAGRPDGPGAPAPEAASPVATGTATAGRATGRWREPVQHIEAAVPDGAGPDAAPGASEGESMPASAAADHV
jgi:O-antigen ligase